MHSVGLSEDWQQIKKQVGLEAMEQLLLRILDCGLQIEEHYGLYESEIRNPHSEINYVPSSEL